MISVVRRIVAREINVLFVDRWRRSIENLIDNDDRSDTGIIEKSFKISCAKKYIFKLKYIPSRKIPSCLRSSMSYVSNFIIKPLKFAKCRKKTL